MNEFLTKIIDCLLLISKRRLYLFIAGVLFAALFAIPLNMTACIIPVLIVAMICGIFGMRRDSELQPADLLALIGGGMIINILTLI